MEDEDRSLGDYTRTLLALRPESESRRRSGVIKWRVRVAIKGLICLVFLVWVLVMMFFPLGLVQDLVQDWISLTQSATLFGATGSFMVAFSGPVLLIALLAALYLSLCDDEDEDCCSYLRKENGASFSLWTFPAVVEGPFGVLTGAEFIAILVFIAAVVFGVVLYTLDSIADYSSSQSSFLQNWCWAIETWGGKMGYIGMFCLCFLFIPVSRGSVLLRVMDIPFEHATRYHVLLGHLTIFIFTLHGFSFLLAWAIQGHLLQYLISWDEEDSIAILPGVIALLCGLIMWATALELMRRRYFELFFYTHYLYIGFVVFFALHVGDFIFSVVLGGILLFMLDRFLRFCQSRKTVDIISVTSHSCGVVELVISKPPNLKYNALSMIFVNVRELSLLQWHPFSVSSSPAEGGNHVAILAKVLGDWTMKLNSKVLSICGGDEEEISTQLCQSKIPLKLFVEGPYGHETPYYLMYKKLVLVAGGIGVSPFVAIIKDVLHRMKQGRRIFPNTIVLIWAIKRSDELSLLPDLESICPSFSDILDIDIQAYVTQQETPTTPLDEHSTTSIYQNTKESEISTLVGTGDNKWSLVYTSFSIVGFIVMLGLVDEYVVNPYDLSNEWYIGLVLLACMAASVVVVGGLVAISWHFSQRKTLDFSEEQVSGSMLHQHKVEETTKMVYGCRPKFEDIFGSMEDKWGNIDVGVIVCGPPNLESSVAKEIRSRSLRRRNIHPIFHFHSHSFQL